ncbi:Phosphoglycerate mutase family [Enterococcus sp. HSIEG1]|nr:Phosphoglycerate mutase family [Enterococcus sp. HSIEG1]
MSHGLTIAFLLHLINNENNVRMDIDNGSVTRLIYENGEFTIAEVGNTEYIKKGLALSQDLLA